MANGITGVDHVLVGVDDLENSKADWQRLGFTLTPRGRHIGRSSGNYCIMFAREYVELLGVVDPSLPEAPNITTLRRRGEGLIAAAMATESADVTHAGFVAAGVEPFDIADLTRLIELPEGDAETRFRLVHLPPERTPEFGIFVCEQRTPELARRPDWLVHPNGVGGLRSATIIVDNPEALAPAHSAIFGPGNIVVTDSILTVFAGAHRLLFVTRDDLPHLFPEWDVPADLRAPRGVSICFRVSNLDLTADYLERAAVPFDEPAVGHLHVPPGEANDVLVEFTVA